VLIGPDGSGKTTISRRLMAREDPSFPRRLLLYESFHILPRLDRLVAWWERWERRRAVSATPAAAPAEHSAMLRPLPAWKSMAVATYHAADMALGRVWLLAASRSRPRLLIFDRSFFDFFFLPGHRNLPRSYLRALCTLVPQPDLILYLARDAAAIYRDKPELSLEEIRRQQAEVEAWIRTRPYAEVLCADRGTDATLEGAAAAIARRYALRAASGRRPWRASRSRQAPAAGAAATADHTVATGAAGASDASTSPAAPAISATYHAASAVSGSYPATPAVSAAAYPAASAASAVCAASSSGSGEALD
jgi:thymidylate kinase